MGVNWQGFSTGNRVAFFASKPAPTLDPFPLKEPDQMWERRCGDPTCSRRAHRRSHVNIDPPQYHA
ncbi:hypothetical protein C1X65_11355 [Pseudomonas sp. FW305-70]|nr:hypothetical protein C1X65_11355 [Pseudomonas sp. FW305-70]